MKLAVFLWLCCAVVTTGLYHAHDRCASTEQYLTQQDVRKNLARTWVVSVILGPFGTSAMLIWGGNYTEYQLSWSIQPMTEQEAIRTCWTW